MPRPNRTGIDWSDPIARSNYAAKKYRENKKYREERIAKSKQYYWDNRDYCLAYNKNYNKENRAPTTPQRNTEKTKSIVKKE